jgi:hypothetical protein
MLPPEITQLKSLSPQANLVYFLVQKFAVIIFALAVLYLYRQQPKPREIRALPIICTIVLVPFFNDIINDISGYISPIVNGNLLYTYFAGFILYTVAMIIMLLVATRTNSTSAKLIADFQITALLINASRRVCAIIITSLQDAHISRSYYCWILIDIFFIIAFAVLRKKKVVKE